MNAAAMADGLVTEKPTPQPGKPPTRSRSRSRLVLFALVVLAVFLYRPATHHFKATQLLMAFADKENQPPVGHTRTFFDRGNGEKVPARVYMPIGVAHPPGVVIVHGVHRKGIEEPRLDRFARAVAATGVMVMTPEVKELSDYKVAPRSIDTVGASIDALRAKLGVEKVGLMGMSFGGGIALLTAADQRYADKVNFVVAVGAHDDLERVSRFFVNNEIPEPAGGTKKLQAHGYGLMVLVYSHIEDFFPPEDVPAARDALRLWLWEEREDAKKSLALLSEQSRVKMDKILGDGVADLKPEILAQVEKHIEDMKQVSPHGRLGNMKANVYLLHGEADSVIPATETNWLAQDVPPARLKIALVSPAIEHVELKSPTFMDKARLVHFMGDVLAEADR